MTTLERLRNKANSLPQTPGVYLMKDKTGGIIYVGKSKKLKNRVTSYFVGNRHTIKTSRMVSLVSDFDYILCDTEIEALTLENVLIKKHTPKYNIKLKDAKSYPYIKITADEYPRLLVTRERSSDRGKYFGPYQGTAQAYGALEVVKKIFALPGCKRQFPRDIGRERPCIYLDMGRCIGPCTGKVSAEEYRAAVRGAQSVLSGNIRDTVATLRTEMEAAAEDLRFERAASLRDSIAALEGLLEKQKVVADSRVDRDVFALYSDETVAVLAVLSVRGGAVISKNEFLLANAKLEETDDLITLVADFYGERDDVPHEIMLDFPLTEENAALLSEYLSLRTRYRVAVRTPERGDGRRLCDLALENAKEAARQSLLEGEREDKTLRLFSTMLGLSECPRRVEAYDISNIGNESITASMVVWEGGKLKKSDYRLFGVKTTAGADDYGSMREILTRRLSHIGDGTASLGDRPDLILLDGGDTHVGVGREVLASLELEIPIFGMVKDDFHKTRAITDGHREISIAKEPNVYAFVYNLQEEAHRFAVKASQGNKIRSMTHSTLERIEGIGPAKARALLAAMPLAKIKNATVEELAAVRGIGPSDAERIAAYFKKRLKKD